MAAANTRRDTNAVMVRFTDKEILLIDAERRRMERAQPGINITRSEVIRSCLWRALNAKGRNDD